MKLNVKKSFVLLLSLAMVLTATVGGTIAFLIDKTDPITNTFVPAEVKSSVGVDGTTFTISNAGNIDAYIRAAVVATWKSSEGIHHTAPNYTVTPNQGWIKGADGYYYYTSAVAPGVSTATLNVSAASGQTAPSGYVFTVEVLAEAIQSRPDSAVVSSWDSVTIENNGTIQVAQASNG